MRVTIHTTRRRDIVVTVLALHLLRRLAVGAATTFAILAAEQRAAGCALDDPLDLLSDRINELIDANITADHDRVHSPEEVTVLYEVLGIVASIQRDQQAIQQEMRDAPPEVTY